MMLNILDFNTFKTEKDKKNPVLCFQGNSRLDFRGF